MSDTVETYSLQDLEKKGFKKSMDGQRWYLGNAKYPTETIPSGCAHLLGRKFDVVALDDRGKITVEDHGEFYILRDSIIKRRPAKRKVIRKIFRDSIIKFNGYSFAFPCDLKDANMDEAREVAKWVLSVTR